MHMDDNVVDFRSGGGEGNGGDGEKPEVVLVCTHCECMTHYINADMSVRCASCEAFTTPEEGEWRRHLPDKPEEVGELATTEGLVASKVLGNAMLARKRVLRTLSEWEKSGELMLLSGYAEDGAGSHWVGMDTQEQKDWTVSKLESLLASIREMKVQG